MDIRPRVLGLTSGPGVPIRPRSCLARLGEAPVPMSSPAALSLPPRAGSDIKPTLNSPAPGDAASSLSASRMAAGLALKLRLLRLLARHRATAVPAAITAWVARWSGLSLLELGDSPKPELHELLAAALGPRLEGCVLQQLRRDLPRRENLLAVENMHDKKPLMGTYCSSPTFLLTLPRSPLLPAACWLR